MSVPERLMEGTVRSQENLLWTTPGGLLWGTGGGPGLGWRRQPSATSEPPSLAPGPAMRPTGAAAACMAWNPPRGGGAGGRDGGGAEGARDGGGAEGARGGADRGGAEGPRSANRVKAGAAAAPGAGAD